MTALYQNRQIRELEQLAIKAGIDEYQLMNVAGQAAFNVLLTYWPAAKRISICCGMGNNGGDGLVIARLAQEYGFDVNVYLIGSPKDLKGSAAKAFQAAKEVGVTCQDQLNFEVDVIVDALLGSGVVGEIKEPYRRVIEAINAANRPVLAVDVPSGINMDTGEVEGCAVKATVTMTFIAKKQGMYTNKAPVYCGTIQSNNLNISSELFVKIKHSAELLSWERVRPLLPKRDRDAHKGVYGHVLVIGGDYGMGGAVRMAGEAAARVGAGLVSVATRPEHVSVVSGCRPELMCYQVANTKDLDPLIERASVVVIGPGLGKTEWAESLLNKILTTNLPKILDADSLNLLSRSPRKANDWILTPHPGEASRLLNVSCKKVQHDRFEFVRKLQSHYGGVVVLKGVGTLVKGEMEMVQVCPAGNPGMATGGMGDILSGVIAGLVAQKLSLIDAAESGVFIHSMAADRAAQEGGERGLLATDLLPHLRNLVNPH